MTDARYCGGEKIAPKPDPQGRGSIWTSGGRMPPQGNPPPGWYPSPDPADEGRFARFWDGSAWTTHRSPIPDLPLVPGTSQPGPLATAETRPMDRDRLERTPPPRRLTWIPRLVLVLVIGILGTLLVIERLDASGPIAYSLTDTTTARNPLLGRPFLEVMVGDARVRTPMQAQSETRFSRVGQLQWTIDGPITLVFTQAYPDQPSHSHTFDLRGGGANVFNDTWMLRFEIVATDTDFILEINQPVARGFRLSREVVHRAVVPRLDERRLAAIHGVDRSGLTARYSQCITEESQRVAELVGPITGLAARFAASEELHGIYGSDRVTRQEYARRVGDLVTDARRHILDARRAVSELEAPLSDLREIDDVIEAHSRLVDAWELFRDALLRREPQQGRSFEEIYPEESSAMNEAFRRRSAAEENLRDELGRTAAAFAVERCTSVDAAS